MIYNFLRLILYIPLIIISLFSQKKRNFLKKRIFQGFNKLKNGERYIWVHCSSVGEINLTDSLIKKMLVERKERIIITIFTDTGYAIAKRKYSKEERIDIYYFPIDDYFLIKRILSKINVKLLVIIETEIWPNLIKLNSKKGKVILVNGRISDRSFKKYLKLRFITKALLTGEIDKFYMQTEVDADRIKQIGATDSKVSVVGNLKFDVELENYSKKEKDELKNRINAGNRKIFVAGSTRTGEDEILIETFKHLKNYILVLVPRHLERIPKLEKLIEENNISFEKLSEVGKEKKDIIIVDKMGILRKFYSISDVAFVGGTLVNIGGHSLLEPLYYRKTPIFGKYLQNVKDISKEILKRNIGFQVNSSEDILKVIKKIENHEVKNEEIEDFFNKNKNVADKILKEINEIIN
ncbi:3-deoxy-D-manno-octulosonic acid transferase [Fusobacterium sp. MFO224]|uniref:3-deoxy-D-manno-octulosonic acid transferase n=1 Tax=Fusobacterium sp. MFO224 TaxID=3378070 RepID=UPI003852DC79